MMNTTKPDALEMLRGLYPHPVPSAFVAEKTAVIAALESERRERAERDAKIREGIKAIHIRYDTCPEDCVRDNCPHPHFVPYQKTMRLLDGGRD